MIQLRTTHIKAGAKSMLHMRHAIITPRPDTDSLRWGRLAHMAVLEPDKFADLPQWTGGARKGAMWTEFEEFLCGGDYVRTFELPAIELLASACRKRLAECPAVAATEIEVGWTDPEYGQAGTRLDAVLEGGGKMELKTTRTVERRAFASQCESLAYRLQLGWSEHGAQEHGLLGPYFVLAVASKPPHETAVYCVPAVKLEDYYQEALQIAVDYRECERRGVYPGRYDGIIMEFERPAWAQAEETWEVDSCD